ncbi:MAG: EamA/RhaT family transporter, partial [Thiotrichales bacterium]|nr:EamA/RhaT family transporter [Thiotrichales bacterium]
GEMSVISPFRYSRLVFALLLSVIILSERPDILTLTGAAIIVASGVYTFVRENVLNKSK